VRRESVPTPDYYLSAKAQLLKFSLRHIQWKEWLIAISLYAVALLYQGYLYGSGDQTQILPPIWAQDHPEAYTTDHYVQAYNKSPVDERTVFHFLFRFLGYANPWIVLVWHVVLSVALFTAWLRISAFFIKSKVIQWIAIALVVTIGFHTNTGSNEIYYPTVVPSLAAKALASWAIYYWLTVQYMRGTILLIVATFIQPLVGLQVFLITTLASVADLIQTRKFKLFEWKPLITYLVAIAPWLTLLIVNNGGHEDAKHFFSIIQFRLSHHFFASAFGWHHLAITAAFAAITIYYFKQKLKWFFIFILIGCLVYEAGVEWQHSPVILYSQWWKTTLWIEVFAMVALGAYFDKELLRYKWFTKTQIALPILFILAVGFYRLSGRFHHGIQYMVPWASQVSDEVDIAQQALQVTPDNAVFIIPIEMTAFRWYSKRNLYVDYKAMLHQESFLYDWYKRLQDVYQFGIKEKEGGFEIHNFSFYLLDDPSPLSIDQWKQMGITHIISTRAGLKGFTLLGSNETYFLYKIN
jgi:hypothetical protein